MQWFVEIVVEGLTADLSPIYEAGLPEEFHSGYYGGDDGRQQTDWRVEAGTGAAAIDEAMRLWRATFGDQVTGLDPVGLTARTEAERERNALNQPGVELLGITDIAKQLGVSHQRASVLARTDPAFPPGAAVSGRTVYPKFLVDLYVQARQQR